MYSNTMYPAIKLSLNNEVRRLTVFESDLKYQTLLETSHRLFPVLKDFSEISFAWVDDEGDFIVLSSEEELSEAVRVMVSQNKSSVRFEIIVSDTDPKNSKEDLPLENAVHLRVTCDECGVHPIVGVRYKCAIRNDYDLCATCESKRVQPYPMVKIYTPQQAPAAIYIAVNDENIPPSPPQAPHAEEIIHDIHNGSWHRPHHPHAGSHHRPPFGPPFGPPHAHHPHHGHPHGPHFGHGHGPHGHPKPWHGHGHGGRGARCGRGRWGERQHSWRKFVDEAVSSAADMANTVADMAQVHMADMAGTLNNQTPNSSTTVAKEAEADEEILMNIALAESLAHTQSNVCDCDHEEEVKESSESESESSESVSSESESESPDSVTESDIASSPSESCAAAPMSTDVTQPVESVNEWELVGRVSPINNNATAPMSTPVSVSVPVVPSLAATFAHGFIAPVVERPAPSPVSVPAPAAVVPLVPASTAATTAAAAAVPSGQMHAQTQSQLQLEVSSELDEWRAELLLLANMGFDNVLDVLPLLRKFCSPPVSQQPVGVGAQPSVEGVQRVVHHLLSN